MIDTSKLVRIKAHHVFHKALSKKKKIVLNPNAVLFDRLVPPMCNWGEIKLNRDRIHKTTCLFSAAEVCELDWKVRAMKFLPNPQV